MILMDWSLVWAERGYIIPDIEPYVYKEKSSTPEEIIGTGDYIYFGSNPHILNLGNVYWLYDFTVNFHIKSSSFANVNIFS